jgi:endonuclease/exonuclease/phosphatase family metal-dependent hydrolase
LYIGRSFLNREECEMELNVMTFNLRVDVPSDGENAWPYRADKASKIIREHQPLVIGTQEGLLRMIEDLEKDLPEYRWIGEGRRGGRTDEFCAIFYNHEKLEVVETGQFWLSEQPDVPNSISWESDLPRICTWGQFRLKGEQDNEFILYNTHLDHISQPARENGAHLIWEKLSKHQQEKQLPMILTGDFNSEPGNSVIQFLRGEVPIHEKTTDLQDAFSLLDSSVGRTFHNFKGGLEGEPIDYIFTTPNVGLRNTEVVRMAIGGSYPSDHYPIITTLTL